MLLAYCSFSFLRNCLRFTRYVLTTSQIQDCLQNCWSFAGWIAGEGIECPEVQGYDSRRSTWTICRVRSCSCLCEAVFDEKQWLAVNNLPLLFILKFNIRTILSTHKKLLDLLHIIHLDDLIYFIIAGGSDRFYYFPGWYWCLLLLILQDTEITSRILVEMRE